MWDLLTIQKINTEKKEKEEIISYITCSTCDKPVYRNKDGKYICPSCQKENKPSCHGW